MKKFLFVVIIIGNQIFFANAQPGSLDKTFGEKGVVVDTAIWAFCYTLTEQSDNKILYGGYTQDLDHPNNYGGLYISRYNNSGNVDKSLGTDGKVIIRQIQGITAYSTKKIIVQPDNKILVLGYFISGNLYSNVGLLRFNEDGSLDNSFGVDGFVFTSLSEWGVTLNGMVLQPDGKIVVAGNKQVAENQSGPNFLIRYLPDGTVDENFGVKGEVFTSFSSNIRSGDIVLQNDGKIITGDRYGATTLQFQLVRYNTDGTIDKNFGTDGITRLKPVSGYFTELNTLAPQVDGKIVAAGRFSDQSMALARFDVKGYVDSTFGNFKGYTYFYTPDVTAIAKSCFISNNKKIILTGNYFKNSGQQVAAVQYNENGKIDSSFGEYGVATGGFNENKYGSDISSGIGLLQTDEKIIVSGSFLQNDGNTYNVALFRFNGNLSEKQIIITKIRNWLQHHNGFTWDANSSVSSYAVQRSYDGVHFNSIARIHAGNISNYTYQDPMPLSGNNYYRLQTTGTDGSVNYSNVLAVSSQPSAISISPNPAKNVLQIQGLPSNQKIKLSVINFSGNEKMQAITNNSSYNLNIGSLKAGNYLLKIEMNGEVVSKKFVKE